jgi:Holliday junction resolvase RusA-like endonuclease
MTITIPGELTDLNTYIKALNSNRYSGNYLKKSDTELVIAYALKCKATRIKNYPVHISYAWYSKDQRKDIDNVAFAKKSINDGLVWAGVLDGDGRRHISGYTDRFFIDKEDPRIEVTITTSV